MIRDEYGLEAQFPEQGSGASFVPAAKLLDAVALLPGNSGQQSDVPSAYTQSKFGTGHKMKFSDTWVQLPKERWPQAWKGAGYIDPVVPLRLPLYGHPLSGKYWENHYKERLLKVGFREVLSWERVFPIQN